MSKHIHFRGSYRELKAIVAELGFEGGWIEHSAHHIQFRAADGACLNWYPTTGTVYIQGSPEHRVHMANILRGRI